MWSSNSTSGYTSKGNETGTWRDICTPVFVTASFTIAKIWRRPVCPLINEWVKNLCSIYTMEYYLAIKKKKILPQQICNSMDERKGHYSKWDKPDTERKILYVLTYMWNQNSQAHRNRNRIRVARSWGWGTWRVVGQRVQTFGCNLNRIWGFNAQHGD